MTSIAKVKEVDQGAVVRKTPISERIKAVAITAKDAIADGMDYTPSHALFGRAYQEGNIEGMIEGGLRASRFYTTLFRYSLCLGDKTGIVLSPLAEVLEKNMSVVAGTFSKASHVINLAKVTAGLAVVISTIALVIEGFNSARQTKFLFLFHKEPTLHEMNVELGKLAEYTDLELENRLTPWFVEKLLKEYNAECKAENRPDDKVTSMKEYFEKLGSQIALASGPDEETAALQKATAVLDRIKTQATKKQIVHLVGVITAIIGIVAGVLMFVAFPPAILLVLFAISIAMMTLQYMLNTGWLNNQNEDGMRWKNCLPSFLQ